MKRICPVCKNEEIQEDHNFCMICGIDLRKEKAPQETGISERSADEINHLQDSRKGGKNQ